MEDFFECTVDTKFADFDVKIKEKIIVAKGEEKILILTNAEEIIVDGHANSTTIQSLVNAAELKIVTEGIWRKKLLNITYKDVSFGNLDKWEDSGRVFWDFEQTPSAIHFDLKTDSGLFQVKTKMLISLTPCGITEFRINDNTLVILEGQTEAIPISRL